MRSGMLNVAAWVAGVVLLASGAMAQPVSPDIVKTLAPEGRLRAAINLGNPVLAQRGEGGGEPRGISVDLARELGRRLGVPVELVPFDAAGRVTDAVRAGAWDIAFLAVDPVRAGEISFTAPYVVIEGTYLVPDGSALRTVEDVDRDGVRIAVGRGSAYDLYLTRVLKNAQIVRAPTSPGVIDLFRAEKLEVAAGVRQQLEQFAAGEPGMRVMPGRFMVIEQALATPKGREAALPALRAFVEEMKASGFVEAALARSDQKAA